MERGKLSCGDYMILTRLAWWNMSMTATTIRTRTLTLWGHSRKGRQEPMHGCWLWPALIENSYAAAHGSYQQLAGGFIAEGLQ